MYLSWPWGQRRDQSWKFLSISTGFYCLLRRPKCVWLGFRSACENRNIMRYRTMHHAISCDIMRYRTIHHAISCDIAWYRTMHHAISCDIAWYRMISHDTSCDIAWYRTIHHAISCDIARCIMRYRMIFLLLWADSKHGCSEWVGKWQEHGCSESALSLAARSGLANGRSMAALSRL